MYIPLNEGKRKSHIDQGEIYFSALARVRDRSPDAYHHASYIIRNFNFMRSRAEQKRKKNSNLAIVILWAVDLY